MLRLLPLLEEEISEPSLSFEDTAGGQLSAKQGAMKRALTKNPGPSTLILDFLSSSRTGRDKCVLFKPPPSLWYFVAAA